MTTSAFRFDINAITLSGGTCVLDGVETLVLLFFARLAAFGRVREALRSIESLLARSPHELLTAVYT